MLIRLNSLDEIGGIWGRSLIIFQCSLFFPYCHYQIEFQEISREANLTLVQLSPLEIAKELTLQVKPCFT